jgi:phenylpropionate dioxygenase-like ring-hydroxylating dioxygenase large terminal subunit
MLRNYWYIACPSSRLSIRPAASQVFDHNLVLFRDTSGSPGALRDRCCHRGVRLSLGRVTSGSLECRYHGWRYNCTGQCVHIPSLLQDERIPEGAEVESYLCYEQDGYVWIWMGETNGAINPPPRISGFDERRWWQGSVPMKCASLMGIENNLDWCHPNFVHRWLHGQFFRTRFRGFRVQCYEVRITESGLVVFAPATSNESQQIPSNPLVSLSFQLPDRVTVTFSGRFRQVIVMHFVPTGETTCRLEWLATRILPFGPHLRWTVREPTIFAQDRRLLESAQPEYERTGGNFERSVAADTATLMVRRIIALVAKGQWGHGALGMPARRIVKLRA